MSEYYLNKYRIPSARLKNWNYASDAMYFITICTQAREHYFGHIKNGMMCLSMAGQMVHRFWAEVPNHFPNVRLWEFVVMPDHMHGVVEIISGGGTNICGATNIRRDVVLQRLYGGCRDIIGPPKNQHFAKLSPKPGSLPTVIRSFKSICTREINAKFPDLEFAWQPRYHDHVIRNRDEYKRIARYIIQNPVRWKIRGLD